MRLSELQTKKIINISDGKHIGTIMDINIKEDGQIDSLIIESTKGLFSLSKEDDTIIYWNEITKIGEDVILINNKVSN